jgi:hypothetical protein
VRLTFEETVGLTATRLMSDRLRDSPTGFHPVTMRWVGVQLGSEEADAGVTRSGRRDGMREGLCDCGVVLLLPEGGMLKMR